MLLYMVLHIWGICTPSSPSCLWRKKKNFFHQYCNEVNRRTQTLGRRSSVWVMKQNFWNGGQNIYLLKLMPGGFEKSYPHHVSRWEKRMMRVLLLCIQTIFSQRYRMGLDVINIAHENGLAIQEISWQHFLFVEVFCHGLLNYRMNRQWSSCRLLSHSFRLQPESYFYFILCLITSRSILKCINNRTFPFQSYIRCLRKSPFPFLSAFYVCLLLPVQA